MSSSGTVTRPPVDTTVRPAEVASPTEDLVTVIFGAFLIGGSFTDGWAHSNILSEIQQEGFFTLWHGLLYTGFAASAAWTFWLGYSRRARSARWWLDGWPAGYRLGALGVLIFMAGGLGDTVWHEVIGVEASVEALLSPSHLLLLFGSVLLLTSPMRSWWASGEGGRRAATGIASMTLGTIAASIFLLYASVFDGRIPVLPYDGSDRDTAGYTTAALGLASYLVTTALLVVPMLMAHRRRATFGVATALVAGVSMFPVVTHEFPQPQTTAAIAAIAAAVLVDWILVRLDAVRGFDAALRLPIAGAVLPALVFGAHLLGMQLHSGIRWPAELWSGSIVVTAAVGALLGGLAARPRVPH